MLNKLNNIFVGDGFGVALHLDEGPRVTKSIVIVIISKRHGKILLILGVKITHYQISYGLALLASRTDCGFNLHLVLGGGRIVENKLVSTITIMWSRRRIVDSTALVHDN
jgi:hypothetical protein